MDEADKDIWSPHSTTETSDAMHDTVSDSDSEGEGEGVSAMDDSEGSLEDAIASMSGKIDRASAVPAAASGPSGDGAAADSSREMPPTHSTLPGFAAEPANKLKSDAASVSVGVVAGSISVSSLGSGLPINVREALRYRIRKKM